MLSSLSNGLDGCTTNTFWHNTTDTFEASLFKEIIHHWTNHTESILFECSNSSMIFFFWFLTWPTGSAKKMCQSPDAAGNCQVLSQLSLVAGHGHIGAEALKSALQRGGLEGWWWKPTWSWWNWWIYTGSRCTLYIDIHMHVYIYISILIFFDEIDEWRGIDEWID